MAVVPRAVTIESRRRCDKSSHEALPAGRDARHTEQGEAGSGCHSAWGVWQEVRRGRVSVRAVTVGRVAAAQSRAASSSVASRAEPLNASLAE